jgi:hypothetical protein
MDNFVLEGNIKEKENRSKSESKEEIPKRRR